jgi:hypothetical protein
VFLGFKLSFMLAQQVLYHVNHGILSAPHNSFLFEGEGKLDLVWTSYLCFPCSLHYNTTTPSESSSFWWSCSLTISSFCVFTKLFSVFLTYSMHLHFCTISATCSPTSLLHLLFPITLHVAKFYTVSETWLKNSLWNYSW